MDRVNKLVQAIYCELGVNNLYGKTDALARPETGIYSLSFMLINRRGWNTYNFCIRRNIKR